MYAVRPHTAWATPHYRCTHHRHPHRPALSGDGSPLAPSSPLLLGGGFLYPLRPHRAPRKCRLGANTNGAIHVGQENIGQHWHLVGHHQHRCGLGQISSALAFLSNAGVALIAQVCCAHHLTLHLHGGGVPSVLPPNTCYAIAGGVLKSRVPTPPARHSSRSAPPVPQHSRPCPLWPGVCRVVYPLTLWHRLSPPSQCQPRWPSMPALCSRGIKDSLRQRGVSPFPLFGSARHESQTPGSSPSASHSSLWSSALPIGSRHHRGHGQHRYANHRGARQCRPASPAPCPAPSTIATRCTTIGHAVYASFSSVWLWPVATRSSGACPPSPPSPCRLPPQKHGAWGARSMPGREHHQPHHPLGVGGVEDSVLSTPAGTASVSLRSWLLGAGLSNPSLSWPAPAQHDPLHTRHLGAATLIV